MLKNSILEIIKYAIAIITSEKMNTIVPVGSTRVAKLTEAATIPAAAGVGKPWKFFVISGSAILKRANLLAAARQYINVTITPNSSAGVLKHQQ